MPVHTLRPLTPSTRYVAYADYSDITKAKPEKSLVEIRKRSGGRNMYGRCTARGIGGGHKQKIRIVDFKRAKHGVEATVAAIEYDPGRSARLALLEYKDGEKSYIIAPSGLQVGAKLMSGPSAAPEVGNTEHENVVLGKAGRSRHRGIRPINRGVSRNPVDHPNGGGAGKSKSGGGWQQLTSPWGLLAKGYRTRNKKKHSNRFILVRRDGRPMKNK